MSKKKQIANLDDLREYVESTTNLASLKRKLKSQNPELLAEIEGSWSFDHEPRSFLEVVYQYLNPTDIICSQGNRLKFEYYRTGYVHCGRTCPCSVEKKKKTMNERYGVDHALQSEEIFNKFKKTISERYGSDSLHEAFDKERTKTNLEKYQSKTPFENKKILAKTRSSLEKSHGNLYPGQIDNLQQRAREKIFEKYGVDTVLALPENHKKAQEVIFEKYGVKSIMALPEFQDSRKETWKKKYGVSHPAQRHISTKSLSEFHDDHIFSQIYESKSSVREIADYFGMGLSSIHQRAVELDLDRKYSWTSLPENQLYDFVSSITNAIQSDRKTISPKEIDISIPDKKIGIEFNGLYYHSSLFNTNRNHLLDKTKMAHNVGYRLIHIYEDEWLYQQEIVKSRLLNILKSNDLVSIGARKCSIIEVDYTETKRFIQANHIQGWVVSKYNFGLVYKDQLLAVATFGKSRYNKNCQWELIRFSTAAGFHVPGAASRLIKHFQKYYPGNLISYADRRWSQGNVYEKTGFTFSHYTSPSYYYVHCGKRLNRQNFQKHKLKNIFENYNENLTEEQNMNNNGFYRIYDCGNSVWIKEST